MRLISVVAICSSAQKNSRPPSLTNLKPLSVWMTEKALTPGRQYTLKLATRSVSGSIALIHHRIDVNTLEHHDALELQLNEIGSCTVTVNAPVVFDPYKVNKGTGANVIKLRTNSLNMI